MKYCCELYETKRQKEVNNVDRGNHLQNHTAPQPRRPKCTRNDLIPPHDNVQIIQ
jgi:hypothetical protein